MIQSFSAGIIIIIANFLVLIANVKFYLTLAVRSRKVAIIKPNIATLLPQHLKFSDFSEQSDRDDSINDW